MPNLRQLTFAPVTSARWADLKRLFGERGACAGCWCMYWRREHSEYERGKGDGNRQAMKRLVAKDEIPGILAYCEEEPIGWCALAPREKYPRLRRSRVLAPIDEQKVWSIVCLFVTKRFRRRGVSAALIEAAVAHARAFVRKRAVPRQGRSFDALFR